MIHNAQRLQTIWQQGQERFQKLQRLPVPTHLLSNIVFIQSGFQSELKSNLSLVRKKHYSFFFFFQGECKIWEVFSPNTNVFVQQDEITRLLAANVQYSYSFMSVNIKKYHNFWLIIIINSIHLHAEIVPTYATDWDSLHPPTPKQPTCETLPCLA